MGRSVTLDGNIKRYFPLIVCLLIAVAAYFQASAIGSLISARMGGQPEALSSALPTTTVAVDDTDAAPILERNPFDSASEPIDPSAAPMPRDTEPITGVTTCASGRVVMIAENDDPDWAFAAIDTGGGKAQLRRVGDTFGTFEVESLAWDRVYLRDNGKRCFLSLGKATASDEPAEAPAASGEIKKISDTEYELDRGTMDAIMGGESQMLNGVRMTPVRRGDRVTAIKLGVVRAGSSVHDLGLRSRDELETLNGVELTSPDKLFEAYTSMAASTRIQLRVTRAGAPTTITYSIR